MPKEFSMRDQVEIDAICNGLTVKQEVDQKIIDTCKLGQTGIPEGFVENVFRQLEVVFTINGENHAEQA